MEEQKLNNIHKFEKQIISLPKNVQWCTKCTISNQRPRIQFNSNGIYQPACLNKDYKKTIDWDKRKRRIIKIT